jgi:hypothetical protein
MQESEYFEKLTRRILTNVNLVGYFTHVKVVCPF